MGGQLGKAFKHLLEVPQLAGKFRVKYVGRADCDVSDGDALTSLLDDVKPNLIINTSAYTAVDKAETAIDLAYKINAKAPELMATYAARYGATLLHYSTDYVFDGGKKGSYVEEDLPNPLSIYGKSKAAGEVAIEDAFATSNASQFAIFRTSLVYGEGRNFIRTILHLAKNQDKLEVVCDRHVVPTSAQWLAKVSLDFLLDENLCLQKFPSGIYHSVPSGKTTLHGLATLVVQSALDAGVTTRVNPGVIRSILAVEFPQLAPRPQNSCMDNAKLHLAIERTGDMSKLQHWNKSYVESVQAYVLKLIKDSLI